TRVPSPMPTGLALARPQREADARGLHEASPDLGVLAALPQSALSLHLVHANEETEGLFLYPAAWHDGALPSRKRLDPNNCSHVPKPKEPDVPPGRILPSGNSHQIHAE